MTAAPAYTLSLVVAETGPAYPASLFAPSRLDVRLGRTTVLVGASGTGKSTLLRLLAGLEPVPTGMRIEGPPSKCKRAYMTQEVRLLPWFTIEANAGIGSRLRGDPADEASVRQVLEQLQLTQDGHKFPGQVSGGMAQRTTLARTLLERADLNLLDEPFAALDAITRRQMQDLVRRHFEGKTVVMVTHDPSEAVRLGDAIYILKRSAAGGPAEIVAFDLLNSAGEDLAEQLFARLQAA